jgi:hypothetical protein
MRLGGGANSKGVVYAIPLSSGWDTGCTILSGGWKFLAWFGYYVDLGSGWYWHQQHDYLCPSAGSTPASIYFYTTDQGWLWTSSTMYPYLYRFSDSAWLWYQKGSDNPRWFSNLTTGAWESR